MHFIRILFLFIIFSMTANAALKELKLKQDATKIKHISNDGKITYYQKSSGNLHYSTNYNFKTILKNPKNTYYQVFASSSEKKVAILADKNFFQNPNFQKDKIIYLGDYGKESKLNEIGKGTKPQLHLEDSILTFFNFMEKSIYVISTSNNSRKKIKIQNKFSPYFVPEIMALGPYSLIYTDVNTQGQTALLSYSFTDKKFTTIYKSQTPGTKIELCKRNDQKVVFAEFPLGDIQSSSQIFEMPIYNNEGFKNFSQIYSSELNDVGNLICDDENLFFVKTTSFNSVLSSKETIIAKLDKENNLELIKESEDISQISKLSNLIRGTRLGKNIVIYGKNSLLDDEIKLDKK